jgi:hypothetical protein
MRNGLAVFLLTALGASAQQVEVVLATYGGGDRLADVTETVRARVRDGRVPIPVTPDELKVSDPAPGTVKTLRVVYRVNGELRESRAKDFETLAMEGVPARNAVTPGGFFGPPDPPSPEPGPAAAPTPAPQPPPAPAPAEVPLKSKVANGACFFRDAGFRGESFCVDAGAAQPHLGAFRRSVRSVRLIGNAKRVWLFSGDRFTGATVRLDQDSPDLRQARGPFYQIDFEDKTASVKVE